MVVIGNRYLNLGNFKTVLFDGDKISLDKSALKNVEENHKFLDNFSHNKLIYGINTSFGPMAQYRISEKDKLALQYNLIRSHCSGLGNPLPEQYAKAVMLARLNTLMLGLSGIHKSLAETIVAFINNDIYPYIPEHGSVGASGDLVQLAQFALNLIGEGDVFYKGEKVKASVALKSAKIKPLQIHIREGIALMNGTAAMTGIGLINILKSQNLLSWSIIASSMINEIVEAFDDHFSEGLNNAKIHSGQKKIAETMRQALKGSKLIRHRPDHLYSKKVEVEVLKDKVQEYYSLRCVPQILGPVYDTIINAESVLLNEVNSANDNPIIDHKNENVYHGGNFHGDYVSFEMDKLKIAVAKMSMMCERQLNYLLNDKLNGKLPPFVNLGKLGLNFGMQGIQFTATSTTAENQTLAYPMYLHSIPNNNDNQDIVSMGTNAALITKKVVDNTAEILAIEFMTILQAVDYLGFEAKLSPATQKVFKNLRKIAPKFTDDKPRNEELTKLKNLILNESPLKNVFA